MRNLTMMTDLYQLTMMYGHYQMRECAMKRRRSTCSIRSNGRVDASYALVAGRADRPLEYLDNLRFDRGRHPHTCAVSYTCSTKGYSRHVCGACAFHGGVQAVPEGTTGVPGRAAGARRSRRFLQCTAGERRPCLTLINHQTLIATKGQHARDLCGERGQRAWNSAFAARRAPTRAFTARAPR